MANARSRQKSAFTDPHIKWEAQRQAFAERCDALMAVPEEKRPADFEVQLKALDDAECALIEKIRTTPAKTIEGALLMIEVPARFEIKLGYHGLHDYETRAFKSNLLAVEIIRGLIQPRKRNPRDLHPKWLRRWRRVSQEAATIYCAVESHQPIPDLCNCLFKKADELRYKIEHTPPRTKAGAAAQLRFLHELAFRDHASEPDMGKKILESVIAFLEHRAG